MAKNVHTRMHRAAAPVSFPNRTPNHTGSDGHIVRSNMSNKDCAVGGLWTFRAQVIHDRLAGLLGQWENVAATQLTHRKLDGSLFPVNVVQSQLDDLRCTQAKVCQTPNHRIGSLW